MALDTKAAAQYIGLAAHTLEKMRSSGGGPKYMKLGRAVRYSPDLLDEWMEARIVSSTSEQVPA